MLFAGSPGAFGGLLPIILALLLAPGGALLCVELAVVIGVDLVKALPIQPVSFLGGNRRQLIVIGLAALDARLLGCRKAGCCQLPCQPRLALCQVVEPEIAVLLEGDRFARGGLRCRALGCCRKMPPPRRNQRGEGGCYCPWSHQGSPGSGSPLGIRTKRDHSWQALFFGGTDKNLYSGRLCG